MCEGRERERVGSRRARDREEPAIAHRGCAPTRGSPGMSPPGCVRFTITPGHPTSDLGRTTGTKTTVGGTPGRSCARVRSRRDGIGLGTGHARGYLCSPGLDDLAGVPLMGYPRVGYAFGWTHSTPSGYAIDDNRPWERRRRGGFGRTYRRP